MAGKIRRFIPPILAFCLLLVPLNDLVTRLGAPTHDSGEYGRTGFVPTPEGQEPIPLPGTILRGEERTHGQEFVLAATPGETARLLLALDGSGRTRSLALERSGSGWIARVDLYRRRFTDSRAGTVQQGTMPDPEIVEGILASPAGDGPGTGRPSGPPPGPAASGAAANAPLTFGTVHFYSGERMSWRWNRDILLLENAP
ncbi:MAG: hypothetical protein EA427_06915 [Spirochaetaceae bacterium]|nr:MAG: hypothetical protein EA427_06915 [Spirochaetaceae bacterium]